MGSLSAALSFLQLHQATLFWAFFTFGLGTVAGFQVLNARYPREYAMAVRTRPGLAYLAVRGALPAVLYVALHKAHLLILPPVAEALVPGLGSEGFLRSRILYAFKSPAPAQPVTEATAGPLDFVTWIQDFFCNRTVKVLTSGRMSKVKFFYEACPLMFDQICNRIPNALRAIGDEQDKERVEAARRSEAIHLEYRAMQTALPPGEGLSPEMERQCRLKLGYALYYALELDNFRAISKEITGSPLTQLIVEKAEIRQPGL